MVLSKSVDEYKTKVAEIFNARTNYSHSEIHARLADRLVQLAAPQPNDKVLDIATGTGFVAISVARLVGERGKVVGVDISAGMLKQAEQAVSASSLRNIELVLTDAETLDYAPGSFDLICCCNALPYMSNVPAALGHWQSLLRPGSSCIQLLVGTVLCNGSSPSNLCCSLWNSRCYSWSRHWHPRTLPRSSHWRWIHSDRRRGRIDRQILCGEPIRHCLDSAVKNPLYGITQNDANQLSLLRGEYLTEARSPSVWKNINTEVGAYFVLAHKPFA